MNPGVRLSPTGFVRTEAANYFVALVRAESKARAEADALKVAAASGYIGSGINQCVEQTSMPGLYRVEVAL